MLRGSLSDIGCGPCSVRICKVHFETFVFVNTARLFAVLSVVALVLLPALVHCQVQVQLVCYIL